VDGFLHCGFDLAAHRGLGEGQNVSTLLRGGCLTAERKSQNTEKQNNDL
jgi:hypothetical protein